MGTMRPPMERIRRKHSEKAYRFSLKNIAEFDPSNSRRDVKISDTIQPVLPLYVQSTQGYHRYMTTQSKLGLAGNDVTLAIHKVGPAIEWYLDRLILAVTLTNRVIVANTAIPVMTPVTPTIGMDLDQFNARAPALRLETDATTPGPAIGTDILYDHRIITDTPQLVEFGFRGPSSANGVMIQAPALGAQTLRVTFVWREAK